MASPTSTNYFNSNLLVQMWDHDPGGTSATLVSPDGGTTVRSVDMRDYSWFAVAAMSSTLTGNGITKLELVAAENAALSTNLTVIKDSGTVAADAVGDWVFVECNAAEVAQEGEDGSVAALRYVGGRITCQNAADEAVVVFIGCPKRPRLNLTPATTIA